MRPPGDRFQESPRDSRAPWDPERRREREHPRDRGRPHDESRDRERRPRSELSPGRGPRHWEDKRGGRFLTVQVMNNLKCLNCLLLLTNLIQEHCAAGLAQSVERLTAEREVVGSIPGAGPTLRVLK